MPKVFTVKDFNDWTRKRYKRIATTQYSSRQRRSINDKYCRLNVRQFTDLDGLFADSYKLQTKALRSAHLLWRYTSDNVSLVNRIEDMLLPDARYVIPVHLQMLFLFAVENFGYKPLSAIEAFVLRYPLYVNRQRPVFVKLHPDRLVLHNARGPAVKYASGKEVYYLFGQEISVEAWKGDLYYTLCIRNFEARSLLLARSDKRRWTRDGRVLSHDKYNGATLYEGDGQRETFKFLVLRNSTAEPNGRFKNYIIRVPPKFVTARAALAWTYGVKAKEYFPWKQT